MAQPAGYKRIEFRSSKKHDLVVWKKGEEVKGLP